MNSAEAILAIRQRWHARVVSLLSLSTVYDDAAEPADGADPWARLNVVLLSKTQTALGVKQYRYQGMMTARVFYPQTGGDASIRSVADTISKEFTGKHAGVRYEPGVPARQENASWIEYVVSVPFFFEELEQ